TAVDNDARVIHDDRQPSSQHLKDASLVVVKHATKHTGVGIWELGRRLASGKYADQNLRLGCVTGLDLASHCRILLRSRPEHKLLYRYLLHYPLYILSEIAIIPIDLTELLGSAIALCLIWPALPLWAGVLLTAGDVIFVLALGDPLGGRPTKMFEWLVAVLVLGVIVCMSIIIAKVDVNWEQAFDGFVPSKTIFASGGIYT
ncbi:Nramp-domain-containing protein, partial [Athelia psychrophila]